MIEALLIRPEPHARWKAAVHRWMREGYGYEDIPHLVRRDGLECTEEQVRDEAALLKTEGRLDALYQSQNARARA